jgi:hypothetical protein
MVDIYALFMADYYHNEKRKLKTVALFISIALSGTTGSAKILQKFYRYKLSHQKKNYSTSLNNIIVQVHAMH